MRIEPVFSSEEIARRIDELAMQIAEKWPTEVTIVGLLRGSFMFAADLLRTLHGRGVKVQMDFMTLSSYGDATKSSGIVNVKHDITDSVMGREVLVIDDILETGCTLHTAIELLKKHGASSVHAAVLLEKPHKLVKDVKATWVGFSVPDRFVVGYGLDYQNYYRDLPYIGAICED